MQAAPQRLRPPLPAQDQPHAGGIHKPYTGKIHDQSFRCPADQGLVQLYAQILCGIVVDLAR